MNFDKYHLPDMRLHNTSTNKKYVIQPYCTSDTCLRKNYFWLDQTYRGAAKRVDKGTDQCPDCNHYLFWKKTEIQGETV